MKGIVVPKLKKVNVDLELGNFTGTVCSCRCHPSRETQCLYCIIFLVRKCMIR